MAQMFIFAPAQSAAASNAPDASRPDLSVTPCETSRSEHLNSRSSPGDRASSRRACAPDPGAACPPPAGAGSGAPPAAQRAGLCRLRPAPARYHRSPGRVIYVETDYQPDATDQKGHSPPSRHPHPRPHDGRAASGTRLLAAMGAEVIRSSPLARGTCCDTALHTGSPPAVDRAANFNHNKRNSMESRSILQTGARHGRTRARGDSYSYRDTARTYRQANLDYETACGKPDIII